MLSVSPLLPFEHPLPLTIFLYKLASIMFFHWFHIIEYLGILLLYMGFFFKSFRERETLRQIQRQRDSKIETRSGEKQNIRRF